MPDPPSLRAQIEDRIAAAPGGAVWTPADFLDLGSRDAVDKALQRLVADDLLRRIDRGLYDKPTRNALTKKPNPADPRQVIDAVARRDQIRVLVDGMTAANDLGLTNAVPSRIVVHTDARLKAIELGNMSITFKPTAASKLYWAGRPAMRLVQALRWLRDTLGDPDDRATLHARIDALLRTGPNAATLRADVADGIATLPTWMQDLLRPMLAEDPV
jgi:CHAD domain-containing protein